MGQLVLGNVPRVVGTVSTTAMLRRVMSRLHLPCDILEARMDSPEADPEIWLPLCRRLGQKGYPVLLTLRALDEGGGWRGTDEAREALYRKALPYVAAVDVEIQSGLLPAVARAARRDEPGAGE